MPQVNYYPVFEPDQVLTDTNLNEMFAYLDQQDHLTRNKLIGIGIVCGLNTSPEDNSIVITKGVGVTSLGYLLQFDGGTYTHVRDYTLPDFPETIDPAVHAYYGSWDAVQLIAADAPKMVGDISLQQSKLLRTHVVVLFLEPQLTDLKNCTIQDCSDKGKRVDLTVRPLLVSKEQLSGYKYLNLQQQKFNFPEIHLQRWNVPSRNMQHPANIIQAFDDILDSQLLKQLDDACTFMYGLFHSMFGNDFDDSLLLKVYTHLVALIKDVRRNRTVYYQYVYDHVDDIIKAYTDFRELVFDVLSECCPDEHLFPLHLMLGEAMENSVNSNTPYRNYFIYSPLFNNQKSLYNAAAMYYRRLVLLLQQFNLPATQRDKEPIRITPSYLGDYALGKRAIPYYYEPEPLYENWDYEKTRRGKASLNYGYFASQYSSDIKTQQPLLYDTEPYNFFRVEGHAGLPVSYVLRDLAEKKLQYNLPIDVVALNLYPNATLAEADKLKCYFSDLESQYNVLVAELLCKLHGLYCAAGKWTFNEKIFGVIFSGRTAILRREMVGVASGLFNVAGDANTGATANDTTDTQPNFSDFDNLELGRTYTTTFAASQLKLQVLAASFVDQARKVDPYRKGMYMRAFCKPDPKQQTVATYYLSWLAANAGKTWPKPQPLDAGEVNTTKWFATAYLHMFYLIDRTEELMATILPYDLNEINYSRFKTSYDLLMEEVEAYADYFDNLYHGLDIINDQKDIASDKPFNLIQEELEAWIINKVVTKLIADSRVLISLCFDERLHQLQYEYRKRVAYILEQHIFGNYAKLKTGLEHKAGVPKGGTFVLVYYDRPNRRPANDFVATNNLSAANTASISETAAASLSSSASRVDVSRLSDQQKLEKSVQQVEKVIEINKELFATAELKNIQDLFSRLVTLPASTETLQIPEGVVFADLYIPYMCCSECAPTAFVFTETKDDTPSPDINIRRTFFCNNEDVKEPIIIDPKGGTVTGQGVTQEGDNYFFDPKGLAEGTYTIVYKLDGKTDQVTITVAATPDPEFNFNVNGPDATGGGIVVNFTALAQTGTHSWNFGDNTSSTETNPSHTYRFNGAEASFEVTHFVSNGNCTLEPITKKVLVQRGNTLRLEIKRNKLCTNDNPERLFYDPAGGSMTCKEKPTAIVIVNNLFHFAPAVSGVGSFHIVYESGGFNKELEVTVTQAPDARFNMEVKEQNADIIVVQCTSQQEEGEHEWKTSDGQQSNEINPAFTFKRDPNNPVITITHFIKGDICSDIISKEFKPSTNTTEESKKTLCYQTDPVALEPNLKDDEKVVVQDAAVQKLDDRGNLTLNPKTKPGTTSFVLKYQVVTPAGTIDKSVTITVNRIDESLLVTFGNGQVSFESAATNVVWTISVQNSPTDTKLIAKDRRENPLSLKQQSEIPVGIEMRLIIEAALSSGRCKISIQKEIKATEYNQLMQAGGSLKL